MDSQTVTLPVNTSISRCASANKWIKDRRKDRRKIRKERHHVKNRSPLHVRYRIAIPSTPKHAHILSSTHKTGCPWPYTLPEDTQQAALELCLLYDHWLSKEIFEEVLGACIRNLCPWTFLQRTAVHCTLLHMQTISAINTLSCYTAYRIAEVANSLLFLFPPPSWILLAKTLAKWR